MTEKSNEFKGTQDNRSAAHAARSARADLPSNPSWQPLEPKMTGEEDLASIFQVELTGKRAELKEEPSPVRLAGLALTGRQEHAPCQPDERPVPIDTLAALAATVFDTTFYLVPRMKEHYLLGDLALGLRTWMPALSAIYGWELERLSIRPDYLKWTLLDFPECLTLKMLAIVRQWTSQQIFKAFPALRTDQSLKDFWSPGYLVDTQDQDFPTQVLIAHVSRQHSPQKHDNREIKSQIL